MGDFCWVAGKKACRWSWGYASDEFAQVILDHGFRIMQRWGGYAGERYGGGPELVV